MEFKHIESSRLCVSPLNMLGVEKTRDLTNILPSVRTSSLLCCCAVWQADDALPAAFRDREMIEHVLADVAGKEIADDNRREREKVKREIIRNYVEGTNARRGQMLRGMLTTLPSHRLFDTRRHRRCGSDGHRR